MTELKLWVKVILFLSSYSPLSVILMLKNIIIFDILICILIILIIIIPNIILFFLIRYVRNFNKEKVLIKKTENKTSNSLNYVVAYFIAFLSFNFEKYQDIIIFFILIFIIFIIYINSDLLFINPILNLFGYNFYETVLDDGRKIMILSKQKDLRINSSIYIRNLSNIFYIEVK